MSVKILLLPGDGIGPEVVGVGRKVIEKLSHKFDLDIAFDEGLIGHSAIEVSGDALPQETLDKANQADSILLGAVGHPSYDNNPKAKVRPEQGLLKIRQELGLFANLRPVKIFPQLIDSSPLKPEIIEGTDILFFRELTGGVYFGKPRGRRDDDKTAFDTMIYSKHEVERISRMAFEAAQKRSKKVMSVDKANVLESSRLWRETVEEISKDYPDVQLTHQFVDSAAMKLLTVPSSYDVILTENLFGDILTDEASQIAGSMGLLASASIGNKIGIFEPIHGSAPDIAGMDIANPLATILSVALMFEIAFNRKDIAKAIEDAVEKTLHQGYRTGDLILDKSLIKDNKMVLGTRLMGEKVVENL